MVEFIKSKLEKPDKVKVSSNDLSSNFLKDKLVAGSNISLVEQNNGGNETLEINVSGTLGDEKVKVSANDTTEKYLGTAVSVSSGANATNILEQNELNDGSNETLQIQIDETKINHNSLLNTHNLTTDIDHTQITNKGTNTHAQIDTFIASKASVNGLASLDGSGKVPTTQIPDTVLGSVDYKGSWNALTNTPNLVTATPDKGDYYVVSVAGTTNLDGITDWEIGDWAIYNGTVWEKVDNTDSVVSVAGKTGVVTLDTDDVTEAGNKYASTANVNAAGAIMHTDVSEAEGILRKTGSETYVAMKTNLNAITAPTVNDDSGDGYVVGSRWIDTTNDKEYVCLDNTLTSAVWKETSIIDISDLNGAPAGAVVGTTDIQTLTNKTLTTPILTLQQSVNPAPTVEGDIQWDTDNDQIKIGDGVGTKTFSDDSQLAPVSHNHAASEIISGTLIHERGGLEADVSAGDGFVEIKGGTTTVIKSNLNASVAPTANDDNTAGYAIGSTWIDTTNQDVYICSDATTASAAWQQVDFTGDTVRDSISNSFTLLPTDSTYQFLEPIVPIDVNLPTAASAVNKRFFFINKTTVSDFSIRILDGGTAIALLQEGDSCEVISTGTNWVNISRGRSKITNYNGGLNIGYGRSGGTNGIVIAPSSGGEAKSSINGLAIGTSSISWKDQGIAIGTNANARGGAVVIGVNASGGNIATDDWNVVIGNATKVNDLKSECVIIGRSSISRGNHNICLGANNILGSTASEANQFDIGAFGYGMTLDRQGEFRFGWSNNYSHSIANWKGSTADATQTELALNNGTLGTKTRFIISANSIVTFEVLVNARDNTSGDCAAYKFMGAIKRDGANNTALVGSITKTVIGEDDVTWDAVIEADDTNEALVLKVTGDATNTVNWFARIDANEIRL